jgi:hypothetical protein
MKQLILAGALVLAAATAAQAQYQGTGSNPNSHPVQGYTTNSGTYVPPHQQTNPNSTQTDNYGARGNVPLAPSARETRGTEDQTLVISAAIIAGDRCRRRLTSHWSVQEPRRKLVTFPRLATMLS